MSMFKIPIGQLSEARDNPVVYRAKLVGETSPDRRYGFFNALRDSIHRFHNSRSDAELARTYLEGQLDMFKNTRKTSETLSRFDWYTAECHMQKSILVRSRQRIIIPLPSRVSETLRCSGEVGRVDVLPSGGYAAWMLRNDVAAGWQDELQMPLIQSAIASLLAVPESDVLVGVFAFGDLVVESKTFGNLAIRRAERQLIQLIRSLGF